jgi:hypothetical protein
MERPDAVADAEPIMSTPDQLMVPTRSATSLHSTPLQLSAISFGDSSAPRSLSKGRNIGLHVLHAPKDGEGIVDIIFVHGLTGDSRTTWLYKDKKTEVHWPTELLPKDYPDARILTFGYDANISEFFGPASSNRIGNHAENMLGALSRLRAKTSTVRLLKVRIRFYKL